MFGLFNNTKSYRFHFSSGSTIVVRNVTDLKIKYNRASGKIEEYVLTFSSMKYNNLFYASPLDIVAIEEI